MAGYYKEANGQLVKAPHNVGNVCNADCDPAIMVENGYRWFSDEEKAAWDADHPVAVPEPVRFSKLAIRRAMRSLGLEEKLDQVLVQSGTFARDWADAQEIDLADPVLQEGLVLAGLTAAEIRTVETALEA